VTILPAPYPPASHTSAIAAPAAQVVRSAGAPVAVRVLAALFGLLRLALSCASALVIVYVILSWVQQGGSPLASLVSRLVAPWLAPIRRVLPQFGGVDLSALVLLLLLQIAGIVLDHVPSSLFT
jgi:YggT family protein